MSENFTSQIMAAIRKVVKFEHLLIAHWYIKRGLQVALLALVLLIAVQLAYPRSWQRPFVSVNGQAMILGSTRRLDKTLDQISHQPYQLEVASQTYNIRPARLGIKVNVDSSVSSSLEYSIRERLIPFSLFYRHNVRAQKQVDTDRFAAQVKLFAQERNQQPIDASLQKSDEAYVAVIPEKKGYQVDTLMLKNRLLTADFGSSIKVRQVEVAPKLTKQTLQSTLSAWQSQTAKPITVDIGGKSVIIQPETLRKWVTITTDAQQATANVTYDTNAIKAWLGNYAGNLYVAPKNGQRILVDDVVTSSYPGANGQAMNTAVTADAIIKATQSGGTTVKAVTSMISYKTVDTYTYTAASRGLQLLINHFKSLHPGITAVSFQELGGQGRSASLASTQGQFVASVYKLYVAYYVYNRIEVGALDINSIVVGSNNQTVASCLEAMIVVSDNNCPAWFGNQLGWGNIDAFARQNGFSATTVSSYRTSAADTANFLSRLYSGSLLNSGSTNAFLDKLGRQIYRSGIPAGSPGNAVYDKVGFYNDYWTDAAIVSGSKGTYVLVIFTMDGGSSNIRDLAQQIQNTL